VLTIENFDCRGIKSNMDQLCFRTNHDDMSNKIDHGDHRSYGTLASLHRALLLMCVLLGLIFQVIIQSLQNAAGADSAEANTQ